MAIMPITEGSTLETRHEFTATWRETCPCASIRYVSGRQRQPTRDVPEQADRTALHRICHARCPRGHRGQEDRADRRRPERHPAVHRGRGHRRQRAAATDLVPHDHAHQDGGQEDQADDAYVAFTRKEEETAEGEGDADVGVRPDQEPGRARHRRGVGQGQRTRRHPAGKLPQHQVDGAEDAARRRARLEGRRVDNEAVPPAGGTAILLKLYSLSFRFSLLL